MMMNLQNAIDRIGPLDAAAMERAQKRWDSIAKPLGSLGLLEKALIQIAGITKSDKIDLSSRAVAVFCGDHGVVAQGVTQCGSEVTAIVAENMTKGDTSVCRMAQVARARVFTVDVGIGRDLELPGLLNRKTAYGTKDMTEEPAMTREEAVKALEAGIETAELLAAEGCRLIATGEMGIGNTTASSALASVFLNRPPEEVTGRGAGLSSEGLTRKTAAIEKAIARAGLQNGGADALEVLSQVGGFEQAAMAGCFLGGAALGIPVLIDGFISAVSALTAVRLCPAVKGHFLASHVSKEPAGELVMEAVGGRPFLTADMCLGEGSGAVAVIPILDMALAVYDGMSTFAEIAIEEYQPLD